MEHQLWNWFPALRKLKEERVVLHRKTSLPTGIIDGTNTPIPKVKRRRSLPTELLSKFRHTEPSFRLIPTCKHPHRAGPQLAKQIPLRTWNNKTCQAWLEAHCYHVLQMTEVTSFRVSQEFKGNGDQLFKITRAEWDSLLEVFGWQKGLRTEGDFTYWILHEGERMMEKENEKIRKERLELLRRWGRWAQPGNEPDLWTTRVVGKEGD